MKIVALANLKGGVGKSTTTLFVAEHWALKHKQRVLVVDLDPQSNVSYMLLSRKKVEEWGEGQRSMPHFFEDERQGTRRPASDYVVSRASDLAELQNDNSRGHVSILPCVPKLWFVTYDLDRFLASHNQDPVDWCAKALKGLFDELQPRYDCVLIDCPPGFGTVTRAALLLADSIISPTIADDVSLRSLGDFVSLGLREVLKIDPTQKHFVVISKYSKKSREDRRLDLVKQKYNVVLPPIRQLESVTAALEYFSKGRDGSRCYDAKYGASWGQTLTGRGQSLGPDVRSMTAALFEDIMITKIR